MLLFITLKVSYYSTRETLKEVGRGEVVFYIYVCIYNITVFSLQNSSLFLVSLFAFLCCSHSSHHPLICQGKKSCPLFPDNKDYHSDIFSLITPFAQQPGRDIQLLAKNKRSVSLETIPHPTSLPRKIDAFWPGCHSVPRGVTQNHLCPPAIPQVALLHQSQPRLKGCERTGRDGKKYPLAYPVLFCCLKFEVGILTLLL